MAKSPGERADAEARGEAARQRPAELRENAATPTATAETEEVAQPLAVTVLRRFEKALLILVGLFTMAAAVSEVVRVVELREVVLADLLLMFLYAEVIGMVAVFYLSRTTPLFYPIFIAITAIARLIVLQSKEMDPLTLIYEALAILLLAGAVALLRKFAYDG